LEKLCNGKPVWLSCFFDWEAERRAGIWNGREYSHVATDFKPEHVALLPDTRPAFAPVDGVGVYVG
jgi:hypothetical protein